jgi:CDP-glucose 4,6-dehydratase
MAASFGGFYRGRRVLVTGHTGFKGAWLSLWLHELGASVSGFALDPPTDPSLYEIVRPGVFAPDDANDRRGDIRDVSALEGALRACAPEVIFHLAAQSLVRRSYREPLETLATNVMGTANLLDAVRRAGAPCTVIVVTSDKCYENHDGGTPFREEDPLGGLDVYSMSKGAAELVATAWRHSFFRASAGNGIRLATARAGNVIGGGDFACDRILPDAVAALARGQAVPVRHPDATRPWQHVLECLAGYLWLATRLALAGNDDERARLEGAFNFGPGPGHSRPVRALVREFLRHWPGGAWEDCSGGQPSAQPYEAGRLDLAIDKAGTMLGWVPVWTFEEAVRRTAAWYRQRAETREADPNALAALCGRQVQEYTAAAAARGVAWAG